MALLSTFLCGWVMLCNTDLLSISTLTEEHPACKIDWWGVDVVIWLEQGIDCLYMVKLMPLHLKTPSSLASFESRLVLPLWYRLTQVVLEKKPLNGYSSRSSCNTLLFCDEHFVCLWLMVGGDSVVSSSWRPVWCQALLHLHRHVVCWLHICRSVSSA